MNINNCPFCDNDIIESGKSGNGDITFYHLKCPKCGATGPKGLSEEQSIKWWNNAPQAVKS